MTLWYTTNPIGFYDDTKFAPPSGAQTISEADYQALFAGQAQGCLITVAADGISLINGPPPAPAPTYSILYIDASAALSAGLGIVSVNTPSLNATYSCNSTMVSHIQSEMLAILALGSFADGGSTLDWPDSLGAVHTFPDTDTFKAFAVAVGAFVSACSKAQLGTTNVLPATSVTIP